MGRTEVAYVAFRSCVCYRDLHNYTVMPGNGARIEPRACCRCPEDCLCHASLPEWRRRG